MTTFDSEPDLGKRLERYQWRFRQFAEDALADVIEDVADIGVPLDVLARHMRNRECRAREFEAVRPQLGRLFFAEAVQQLRDGSADVLAVLLDRVPTDASQLAQPVLEQCVDRTRRTLDDDHLSDGCTTREVLNEIWAAFLIQTLTSGIELDPLRLALYRSRRGPAAPNHGALWECAALVDWRCPPVAEKPRLRLGDFKEVVHWSRLALLSSQWGSGDIADEDDEDSEDDSELEDVPDDRPTAERQAMAMIEADRKLAILDQLMHDVEDIVRVVHARLAAEAEAAADGDKIHRIVAVLGCERLDGDEQTQRLHAIGEFGNIQPFLNRARNHRRRLYAEQGLVRGHELATTEHHLGRRHDTGVWGFDATGVAEVLAARAAEARLIDALAALPDDEALAVQSLEPQICDIYAVRQALRACAALAIHERGLVGKPQGIPEQLWTSHPQGQGTRRGGDGSWTLADGRVIVSGERALVLRGEELLALDREWADLGRRPPHLLDRLRADNQAGTWFYFPHANGGLRV